MSLAQRYAIGAKRHWRQTFAWALGVWGACWLIVNSISFFFEGFRTFVTGWNVFTIAGFIVITVFMVIYRLPIQTKVLIFLPTTNTAVEILFADIFQCSGHWAIPVNEYFDGELGLHVSQNSVHGQFIQRCCEGNKDRFEELVDAQLKTKKFDVKQRATTTRNKSFAIGTTAVVDLGERKCFLFALATSDGQTAKAFASVPMMWTALQEMWAEVRAYSNGNAINVPLVGSGRSSMGIEPMHLLRLMLLSLLVATHEREVTKLVRIVLHESMLDRIDLDALCEDWK